MRWLRTSARSRVHSRVSAWRMSPQAASKFWPSSLRIRWWRKRVCFLEMTDEFPDHIQVLRSEHREIEKVLGEAAGGFPDDPTWPHRLLGVLHMLRDHILKEQDGVFPAALAALDADQWGRIEAVRAQVSLAPTALAPKTSAATSAATSASIERNPG